jgi:hypothetical protein
VPKGSNFPSTANIITHVNKLTKYILYILSTPKSIHTILQNAVCQVCDLTEPIQEPTQSLPRPLMLHTDNGGHRCLGLLRLWCAVGASSITGKKKKKKKREKGRSGKVGRIEDGDDGRTNDEDGSWLLVSVSPVLVLVLGLEARSCCC